MPPGTTPPVLDRIFHGRENELQTLEAWVEADQPEGKRAGIVIGTPGRGKSALLARFADKCQTRPDSVSKWHVQLLEATGDQGAAEIMSHLLSRMLSKYRGIVKKGPNDRDTWRALLKLLPKIGNLLENFVRKDSRPGWQKFLAFSRHLSDAVIKRDPRSRLVFIVDPRREFTLDHPGDWIPLAEKLPEAVRLIVAQRPDDTLASHATAKRHFTPLLNAPLDDLPQRAVEEWYEHAFKIGLLPSLDGAGRGKVSKAAFARYGGYPFAHHALIATLKLPNTSAPELEETIASLPKDTLGLLDELYGKLRELGDAHHTAALTLQSFRVPTPIEYWAKGAGLSRTTLVNMLESPGFTYLFDRVETSYGPGYLPFHARFAERLDAAIAQEPSRKLELVRACQAAICTDHSEDSTQARSKPYFALFAAMPLALRSGDPDAIIDTMDTVNGPKLRLGLLDSLLSDINSMLLRFHDNPGIIAACHGDLGSIMHERGCFEEAQEHFRSYLDICLRLNKQQGLFNGYLGLGNALQSQGDLVAAESAYRAAKGYADSPEKLSLACNGLGNIYLLTKRFDAAEGMFKDALQNISSDDSAPLASIYGNMGSLLHSTGRLTDAEAAHNRALEMNSRMGRQIGMAINYANIGDVLRTRGDLARGDLDGARHAFTKAHELFTRLGASDRAAKAQRMLDELDDPSP